MAYINGNEVLFSANIGGGTPGASEAVWKKPSPEITNYSWLCANQPKEVLLGFEYETSYDEIYKAACVQLVRTSQEILNATEGFRRSTYEGAVTMHYENMDSYNMMRFVGHITITVTYTDYEYYVVIALDNFIGDYEGYGNYGDATFSAEIRTHTLTLSTDDENFSTLKTKIFAYKEDN